MPIGNQPENIKTLLDDPTRGSNPEVQRQIEDYYKTTYGYGDPDDEGAPSVPPANSDAPGKPGESANPNASSDLSESGEVGLAVLKTHWGDDFDTKFAAAGSVVSTLPVDVMSAIEKKYPGIGNDPHVMDILAKLGSNRR